MGSLTTHVLDTVTGKPASGLRVDLFSMSEDNTKTFLSQQITNNDGRCDQPLAKGDQLSVGTYQVEFHVGNYFKKCQYSGGIPIFLSTVPIRFLVGSVDENYHVPLLVSPNGYSTYRGS